MMMPRKISDQLQKILNARILNVKKKSLPNKTLRLLAKTAEDQIKKRVRLGKGVSKDGGKVFPLKPLSDNYIDYRDDHSHRLGRYARLAKSNLNATGQLINSITGSFFKKNKTNVIFVDFKENRKRELDGGRARITHKKLAKYVQEDRPFFFLAKFELNKLRSIIIKAFKDKPR